MEPTPWALYGIAARPRMASAVRLYSPFTFGLDSIQCNALHWFHTALRTDSILAFSEISYRNSLRIWYEEDKMKRNLLLEYSEELAVGIAKLCVEYKIDSNTVFQIKKSSSSVFCQHYRGTVSAKPCRYAFKTGNRQKGMCRNGSLAKINFRCGFYWWTNFQKSPQPLR